MTLCDCKPGDTCNELESADKCCLQLMARVEDAFKAEEVLTSCGDLLNKTAPFLSMTYTETEPLELKAFLGVVLKQSVQDHAKVAILKSVLEK